MRKALIIFNPNAGMKLAARHLPRICNMFCGKGYLPSVYMTQHTGDGVFAAESLAADKDLIVCIGGDGTLSETIEGMRNAGVNIPVGYIPAGSTNDTATSLHLSRNIIQATKDILGGKAKTLDLGEINGKPFCYVVSCGAFTRVTYTTPQPAKNVLGNLAYFFEATNEVSKIAPIPMQIETDNLSFSGDFLLCAFSNSTSMGGVLKLGDDLVDLNDGKLELLLVRTPKDGIELGQIIAALTQSNFNTDLIHIVSTSYAKVTLPENVDWTRDGEQFAGAGVVELRCVRDAVRFVLNGKESEM